MIVLDTETTGLDPRKCRPTHIGLYNGIEFKMTASPVVEVLWNFGHRDTLIMHNGKFDTSMLWWDSKKWIPWTFDTMLLSQLYDSRQRHSLDNLGQLYIGESKWGDKKVLQAIKKGGFWMLDEDTQQQYLRRDCEVTWKLFQFFKTSLSKELWRLYNSFDLPVSLALAKVELNGFTIDTDLMQKYKERLTDQLSVITEQLKSVFGDINFNSPKQLLPSLQNVTGITLKDTDESTLKKISKYSPSVKLLLEYRETKKYLSTYIEGIEKHLYEGKVYPQFHLAGDRHAAGTQTGRTSSSNPNLQNQPRTSSGPVNVRSLFTTSNGNVLVATDYAQLELKVAAFLSKEDKLLEGDVHQMAADVLKVDRQVGKTCNFAMLYGAGFNKLYATTGGSKHVQTYVAWFKESFPKAVAWVDDQRGVVEAEGRISTYLGRVRFMDQANAAANTVIQGSAGDIGKEALLRVQEAGYKVLGLIHDEVIVEVPEVELQEAAVDIPRLMTTGLRQHAEIATKSQLSASVKTGRNWGCMEEVKNV